MPCARLYYSGFVCLGVASGVVFAVLAQMRQGVIPLHTGFDTLTRFWVLIGITRQHGAQACR